jgi:hypothetical protein
MNAHLFTILDRVPAPTWAANDDEAIRDSNPADIRFLAYGAIAALLLCLGGDGAVSAGRVGKPTGLSQAEPVARLGPSGFDPSRDETVLLVSDADKELAWLDVSTEALGQFCRWFIIKANQTEAERAEAEDMPMLSLMAMHAGVALARFAHEANATTFTTKLTAVKSASGPLGDWKITVKQLRPASAIEARSDKTAQTGLAEGESAAPNGGDAHA